MADSSKVREVLENTKGTKDAKDAKETVSVGGEGGIRAESPRACEWRGGLKTCRDATAERREV
jgi:hypothetical protein